ncbi:MAG: transposase [Bacillus subtilis]|nr:transposase [Bacillus subtilis]
MMEELIESGKTMKEVSEELGISPSTLREYRHVIEEQEDPTIDPYIDRVRDVMEDRDLIRADDPKRHCRQSWGFHRYHRS